VHNCGYITPVVQPQTSTITTLGNGGSHSTTCCSGLHFSLLPKWWTVGQDLGIVIHPCHAIFATQLCCAHHHIRTTLSRSILAAHWVKIPQYCSRLLLEVAVKAVPLLAVVTIASHCSQSDALLGNFNPDNISRWLWTSSNVSVCTICDLVLNRRRHLGRELNQNINCYIPWLLLTRFCSNFIHWLKIC
jgi:hypothetical protein